MVGVAPSSQTSSGWLWTFSTLMTVEVSREETIRLSPSSRYSTVFRWSQSHSPACQKKSPVRGTGWVSFQK